MSFILLSLLQSLIIGLVSATEAQSKRSTTTSVNTEARQQTCIKKAKGPIKHCHLPLPQISARRAIGTCQTEARQKLVLALPESPHS
jgi:hypothetical protein